LRCTALSAHNIIVAGLLGPSELGGRTTGLNRSEKLASTKWLRKLVLPVVRAAAFDFRARHPWVPGDRYRLNSYAHKGYWYAGRQRELRSMELFAQLIAPGDHVVEVGGHIGYISVYYMHLVGPQGAVTVFEPGSNNLPYIRPNLAEASRLASTGSVTLLEKAVGCENGRVTFYEDQLTGQNNSLVRDFAGLSANAAEAGVSSQTNARTVEIVTLDAADTGGRADFVKIDVEGAEFDVLAGMQKMLAEQQPIVMVETWEGNPGFEDILPYFAGKGYELYHELGYRIERAEQMDGNLFCLHSVRHRALIERVFGAGVKRA
jgi:FkbM family methyltransferase